MRRTFTRCRLHTFAVLAVAIFSAGCTFASEKQPLVVFLVRHAEKVDASRDPALSADGKRRAEQLADCLRDAEIQFVHSSDFVRTRNTAKPVVKRLGLKLALYDPRKLPELVKRLKSTGGRHLVVGHSNTTPAVAKLLGGESGKAIHEKSEFDRLYVLTIDATGATTTVLLRYGTPPKVSASE